MEQWKPIENTEGRIEVSNHGRIRSNLRDGRILKPTPDHKGYLRISVTIDGERRRYKVHREVAKAFIPNPDNLPQVNHINGDKTDNSVNNLEWVTNRDNAKHALNSGLWANVTAASARTNELRKTKIYSIDIITGERRDFESISEAERFFNSRYISDVLKGKREKAAGQRFYRR